jgi:hypothetical protein
MEELSSREILFSLKTCKHLQKLFSILGYVSEVVLASETCKSAQQIYISETAGTSLPNPLLPSPSVPALPLSSPLYLYCRNDSWNTSIFLDFTRVFDFGWATRLVCSRAGRLILVVSIGPRIGERLFSRSYSDLVNSELDLALSVAFTSWGFVDLFQLVHQH